MPIIYTCLLALLSNISSMLDARRYRFEAEFAYPLSGQPIQLTPISYFDLTIKGDTLVSFLPFYGRSYSAPMSPDETGFKFTTTDFRYTEEVKKDHREIIIEPLKNDVQSMFLIVDEDGSASLSIISNRKQSIRFSGWVRTIED